jgi:hypothetical protein
MSEELVSVPFMRNALDASSLAQRLDGNRLTGSLRFPAQEVSPHLDCQQGIGFAGVA